MYVVVLLEYLGKKIILPIDEKSRHYSCFLESLWSKALCPDHVKCTLKDESGRSSLSIFLMKSSL
jgi:hypothetical protein